MNGKRHHGSRVRSWYLPLAALLALLLLSQSVPAGAQEVQEVQYDAQEAGHPLRLLAFLVAPIGVLADYCLMRPAFWLGQREPFRTIFGFEYVEIAGLEGSQPERHKAGEP